MTNKMHGWAAVALTMLATSPSFGQVINPPAGSGSVPSGAANAVVTSGADGATPTLSSCTIVSGGLTCTGLTVRNTNTIPYPFLVQNAGSGSILLLDQYGDLITSNSVKSPSIQSTGTLGGFQGVLYTPASSATTCTTGTFANDANYAYYCTATNTWMRSYPLTKFTTAGANTDQMGELTLSGGTVTYTFAGTYANHPNCTASDASAISAVRVVATTTTLTISGTGTDVVEYLCGHN